MLNSNNKVTLFKDDLISDQDEVTIKKPKNESKKKKAAKKTKKKGIEKNALTFVSTLVLAQCTLSPPCLVCLPRWSRLAG